MRNLVAIGVVLIIVGAAALIFGQFGYTETKPVVKAGPIQINAQEEHHIAIPTIAGVVIVLAGLGLVLAGRRSA